MATSFNKDFYRKHGYYPWQNPYEGCKSDGKELEVHCLSCDEVFTEHLGIIIEVCPQCGNTDMMNTVYIQREESSNDD